MKAQMCSNPFRGVILAILTKAAELVPMSVRPLWLDKPIVLPDALDFLEAAQQVF